MTARHFAALGLTVWFATSGAHATTFDAVSDFSIASNPNGAWSYVDAGSLMSATSVGSTTQSWSNGGSLPTSASVIRNVSSSTITLSGTVVIPTTYLNLDPQGVANVGLVFTAATAGVYTIAGGFLGDDTNELTHAVEVLDNNTVIYAGTIASFQQSDAFNLSEILSAGDTLSFLSLTGSSFHNLSTGLQASITIGSPVPEPASMTLAVMGLVGVAAAACKRQRT